MFKNISLYIILTVFSFSLDAQTKWTEWKNLYTDNTVKVEIQFKIHKNSCDTGARSSKYRYKISGKYTEDKTLFWKLKYKDCNNLTKVLNNKIIVGGNTVVEGIVESPDYVFKSKKVIKEKYDISYSLISSNNKDDTSVKNVKNKTNWTKWEKLYSDKTVTIQIQYKLYKNACKNGGKNNKFRYKITGLLHKEDKYVKWKMKYVDCNKNIQILTNKIDVGQNGSRGIVESMDYIFTGNKILKKHYNVKISVINRQSNKPEKIKPNDKKAYKVAKKRIRKTIPHKYVFQFGDGLYTDLGITQHLNSNINLALYNYNWMDTYGFFRKIGIKKKFTNKRNRDISRATLIGVFTDIGYKFDNEMILKDNGIIKTEFGTILWQWFRISGGIINYNWLHNIKESAYSGTVGLNIKLRNFQFFANYNQVSDKSFNTFNSYINFGLNYNINLFRKLTKLEKERLKNQY